MKRVLVIEDDPQLLLGLKDNLEVEGYEVATAADGEAGLAAAMTGGPDVVVLDLMLPRLSGFDVCRSLKERGVATPILMLTARSSETDKVLGLELGADDYVTKPFNLHELLARIRVLLRRAAAAAQPAPCICRFDDVEIDFGRQEARKTGQRVPLSALEFDVLRYLTAHRGDVVSRDQLLADVWGYKSYPTTRSVDNLMARLRQKLESHPHEPRHLLTVHGTGYRFVD